MGWKWAGGPMATMAGELLCGMGLRICDAVFLAPWSTIFLTMAVHQNLRSIGLLAVALRAVRAYLRFCSNW
jgi:hypothetical protein